MTTRLLPFVSALLFLGASSAVAQKRIVGVTPSKAKVASQSKAKSISKIKVRPTRAIRASRGLVAAKRGFKAPYVRPPSAKRLLTAYRQRRANGERATNGKKLTFEGVGKRDVYNPTAPFRIDGKNVLAGRVESRNSETDTQVRFFVQHGKVWKPLKGAPSYKMQDPFVAHVNGQVVLGGVETTKAPNGGLQYRTVFYKGTTLGGMKRFAEGPVGMKDIRLAPYGDRILVMTRPQGEIGGRGKIGVTVLDKLSDLNPATIAKAPIIRSQFRNSEWGGANEIKPLGGSRFGVIGHIARFDGAGNRHYYPTAFVIDAASGTVSPHRILLERADLPAGLKGASKRPDLRDVLFSGGLTAKNTLYVGAGDAEVYSVKIANPFAGLKP